MILKQPSDSSYPLGPGARAQLRKSGMSDTIEKSNNNSNVLYVPGA